MNIRQTILDAFKARISVLHVVGYDEAWLLRDMVAATLDPAWPQGMGLYVWDMADQFTCLAEGTPKFETSQPATVDTILGMLENYKGSATFVIKDAHMIWEQKRTPVRKLRNMAQRWPSANPQKNLILLVPDWSSEGKSAFALPPELKHDVVSIECPKPDKGVMEDTLGRVAGDTPALQGVRPELRAKIRGGGPGAVSGPGREGISESHRPKPGWSAGRKMP